MANEVTGEYVRIFLETRDLERLDALCKVSGLTRNQAIQRFIRSCQPGGSGWKHPSIKKAEPANG